MENFIDVFLMKHKFKGFKKIKDIDIDNLREFLYQVLDKYAKHEIYYCNIFDISETLEDYFYDKYKDQFPETSYPAFEDDDPRRIGFTVMNYMHGMLVKFIMFPEDVPYFKKFLYALPGKESEELKQIENYVKNFDYSSRIAEANKRGILG